ncbi:hypothetical protein [Nonomuraea sp. NPDC050783]|uniref:hypothetical protein n=1 Tax=Nonomuraea sp. NPDC050783 TaxID=3154634 RepID=UPI003465AC17
MSSNPAHERVTRAIERLGPLGAKQEQVLTVLLKQLFKQEDERKNAMIHGPMDAAAFKDMVIVYDDGKVQINYVTYEDGKLWEVNFSVDAQGSVVSKAIGEIPSAAVPDGRGWEIEDRRTYATFWEAA